MGLVSVMKRIMNQYERTRINFIRHFVKCQTCASAVPSNFCLKGKELRDAYLKAERIQLGHE